MKTILANIILVYWFLYCHIIGYIVSEIQYRFAKRANSRL